MTFQEKYKKANTWYERASIMEIFHLTMRSRDKSWTLRKTATEFNCSMGLVSENLKLAASIHEYPEILKEDTRIEALEWIKNNG